MTARRLPVVGGGYRLPPRKVGAQLYLPRTLTPTRDTNSLLADARIDGEYLELDLQNPGAHPMPDASVVWEMSLRDLLGMARTSFNMFTDMWALHVETDGLLPADTHIFAVAASNSIVGSGEHGIGGQIRASGNGARLNTVGLGWGATAITGSAAVRRARGWAGKNSDTQARTYGGFLMEADGTVVASSSTAVVVTLDDPDRIGFGAGWVAGTGGPTETVRLRTTLVLLRQGDAIASWGL